MNGMRKKKKKTAFSYTSRSTYKYISGVPFFFVETQTRLRRYSIMNIIVVPHLRKLPETVKKKIYQNWSNNHITPGGIFYQKYFFFFFFFEVINMFRPKNSQNFTNQNWSRSQNSKKKINQSWSRSHYPWWYFLPKKKKTFFQVRNTCWPQNGRNVPLTLRIVTRVLIRGASPPIRNALAQKWKPLRYRCAGVRVARLRRPLWWLSKHPKNETKYGCHRRVSTAEEEEEEEEEEGHVNLKHVKHAQIHVVHHHHHHRPFGRFRRRSRAGGNRAPYSTYRPAAVAVYTADRSRNISHFSWVVVLCFGLIPIAGDHSK